jgi:hypothetical protein
VLSSTVGDSTACPRAPRGSRVSGSCCTSHSEGRRCASLSPATSSSQLRTQRQKLTVRCCQTPRVNLTVLTMVPLRSCNVTTPCIRPIFTASPFKQLKAPKVNLWFICVNVEDWVLRTFHFGKQAGTFLGIQIFMFALSMVQSE